MLLRRDVLDALVIDLQNRRATRANDLRLEEENGRLVLTAADTSARALLRRVSRGLFASSPDDLLGQASVAGVEGAGDGAAGEVCGAEPDDEFRDAAELRRLSQ